MINIHPIKLLFLCIIWASVSIVISKINDERLFEELQTVSENLIRPYVVKLGGFVIGACYLNTPGSSSQLYFASLSNPRNSLISKVLDKTPHQTHLRNHTNTLHHPHHDNNSSQFYLTSVYWGTPCFHGGSLGNSLTDYFESIGR